MWAKIVDLRRKKVLIRQISHLLGIAPSTVQDTWQRYEQTEPVASRKRPGRPAKVTPRKRRMVIVNCKRNRRRLFKELANELNIATDICAFSSRIRQILLQYGLRGCVAKKKLFISVNKRRKRLLFAKGSLELVEAGAG